MALKITRDVLESYLVCKYKGYLKQEGQQGIKSDFETLFISLRDQVKLGATDKILARHPGDQVVRGISLATSTLKRGPLFILEARLEDQILSLSLDGLKKVLGPSNLGDFHYIPMLFGEG